MQHRNTIECVDELLRKITSIDKPFGGKVLLAVGDFRQTAKKLNCTIMRNLDINAGLVKNRRIIIHDVHHNFITIQLIGFNSANDRNAFCIPRINFSFQPARCPWTVNRRQFPLRLAYATTFNSC